MSFKSVGSFVKKKFKKVKDVAKKVWKPVLITGAIAFTAGVATVGFAGVSAATSGGLLSGIGTTMLAGGQALAGAVGIGSGLTAGVADATGLGASGIGTNILSGTLATGIKSGMAKVGLGQAATSAAPTMSVGGGSTDLISQGLVNQGMITAGAASSSASAVSTAASSGGFFGKVGSALGRLTQTDAGKMMLFSGISQGVQAYAADKQSKKERKRQKKLNFFGGPMRGGSSELPADMLFPSFGDVDLGSSDQFGANFTDTGIFATPTEDGQISGSGGGGAANLLRGLGPQSDFDPDAFFLEQGFA